MAENAVAEGKLPAETMARIDRFAGKIDHYLDEPPIICVHVLMYRLAVFVPGISVHGIIPSSLTT